MTFTVPWAWVEAGAFIACCGVVGALGGIVWMLWKDGRDGG